MAVASSFGIWRIDRWASRGTVNDRIGDPEPRGRRVSSLRTGLLGVVLMGLWLVAGTALIIALAMTLDPERLDRYGGRILDGFVTTIQICALSLAAGAVVSLPVAAGRLSENRYLGALAYGYSYFFRGTAADRSALPHLLRRR